MPVFPRRKLTDAAPPKQSVFSRQVPCGSIMSMFSANICYKYLQGYKDSSVYKVHSFSDSQKEIIMHEKLI